jgi:hypothetical protein
MVDRLLTLASALAWLLFSSAVYSTPLLSAHSGDSEFPRALTLQIASVVIGITLLCIILFNSQRPSWPVWSRYAFFVCGTGAVIAMWQLNLKGPWPMALHALALCAIALPIGWWIGSHMQRVTHLVPLGIAMSMADIFSVATGPSKGIAERIGQYQTELAQKAQEAASNLPPEQAANALAEMLRGVKAPFAAYLVAHMPLAGTGSTSPILGIGDFVALAFIFRAAWVHHLPPGLVFSCALGSTIAALAIAQSSGIPIPALPVICLGTIGALLIAEPRMRRLDKQETVASAAVFVLFSALIAARWFN